jgi:hypothetical protein
MLPQCYHCVNKFNIRVIHVNRYPKNLTLEPCDGILLPYINHDDY